MQAEQIKESQAEQPRLFTDWFARMKGLYDVLWEQHRDLDIVRWAMPADENFVITDLPPRIAKALGTSADSLLVSPNNMAKQFRNHPDLMADEYTGVFGKMNCCTEIYDSGGTRIALILQDGAWYRMILKATTDRTEVFMVSLHRVNEEHSLIRIRKQPRIL